MYVIRERYEGDAERFEMALKKAKSGIKEAWELFEDMKDQFGERGSYGERYGERYGSHYSRRDDEDWSERRYRH